MYSIGLLSVVLSLFGGVLCNSYRLGYCPEVKPMTNFDLNKMLGVWYVIEQSYGPADCATFNISADRPGSHQLELYHQYFSHTSMKTQFSYTGMVTQPDNLGVLKVEFPLKTTTYTVINTDYEGYAVLYHCHRLGIFHRSYATVLSRVKTLDPAVLTKLHDVLSNNNLEPSVLVTLNQNECDRSSLDAEDNVDLTTIAPVIIGDHHDEEKQEMATLAANEWVTGAPPEAEQQKTFKFSLKLGYKRQ